MNDDDEDAIKHPIQPTGFGVADLEIAREQDALAEPQQEVGADLELPDETDERQADLRI